MRGAAAQLMVAAFATRRSSRLRRLRERQWSAAERASVIVRHFYGLPTVKGRFDRYDGTLQLNGRPAVELVIDADRLDTKHRRRDEHLRSTDFFDVANHPQVRFESDDAALAGDTLKVRGHLHAAGRSIPLGILRAPSKLMVRGRLVPTEDRS
jgi:polyisoprenoid-binding protein YceI